MIGKVFGELKVLKYAGQRKSSKHYYWLVQCNCGNVFEIRGTLLKTKHQTRCPKCSILKGNTRIHGLSKTRMFYIWQHIIARCYNENTKFYERYGGRNIIVDEVWKNNFINFYNWSMNNGYAEHLTIDRINNDGNYEPSNCRWATKIEQANNTSTNRFITYKGKTQTLSEWSRELNIEYYNLLNRLNKYNWSIEKSFTTPVKKYN